MSRYEIWLYLHITAAIIWIGAATTLQFLLVRADRMDDPKELLGVAAINEWLVNRLFIPAALSTLVFGIVLVADGPWSFDQLWVVIGLLGFALSFVNGLFVLTPMGKRAEVLIPERGPEHPDVLALLGRVFFFSRLELGVLYVVVLDMAVKPTADSAAFWIIAGVGLAFVAVLASRDLTKSRPAAVT